MELIESIEHEIQESIVVKAELARRTSTVIAQIADALVKCIRGGHKLLLFGNGGSAADAQHIAAEFVGRYKLERPGLPAIALGDNPAILTAVANDYHFDQVFARQIQALGKPGDVAIAISTSGDSPNVLHGIASARAQGMLTVGFTGNNGGKMREEVDLCLCVPSHATPRIQECHMLAGHILSGIVENRICGEESIRGAKLSAVKVIK